MPSPSPQPERRRKPRALADFVIDLAASTAPLPVRLRDLSELGLCCTCDAKLRAGTNLTVVLTLPGSTDRHQLTGRVVRCAPADARGAQFTVGVQFREVPPVARAAIGGYVARGRRAP